MAAYLQRRAWDEREPSFILWALWKKRLELQATGFLDSRFSICSVDSPSQTALPAILYFPSDRLRRFGFLRHAASIDRKVSTFNPAERLRLLGADSRGTAARSYGHERATSQRGPPIAALQLQMQLIGFMELVV
jgi:hypothetical protein